MTHMCLYVRETKPLSGVRSEVWVGYARVPVRV